MLARLWYDPGVDAVMWRFGLNPPSSGTSFRASWAHSVTSAATSMPLQRLVQPNRGNRPGITDPETIVESNDTMAAGSISASGQS